ncbi:MAG: antibiotic biosynthesis monooxygenase [Deltaproteobacteria bacterium]|nr:antibiotic biosynthesis monooxygenase [Deltaproteobacteria bacterium]
MILEAAMLNVRDGLEGEFEASFGEASHIISLMQGYVSHELHKCIEAKGKYLLLVRWNSLEDHTVGFRGSREYQERKRLLHHFYEPFPTVEHFEQVELNGRRQT